jgi:hypothetical protein
LENSSGSGWNVYEDRGGAGEGCVNQQGGFNPVIDGVLELRFTCYDSTMAPRTPWGTGTNAGLGTQLPYAVDIQMRLIDGKSLVQWKQLTTPQDKARLESQVALTFSKMVFLGGRQ